MEGKEDSFSMADLETAVSMASIADENYPSQVFTGMNSMELLGDHVPKQVTSSNTSLMGSVSSLSATESANSFQYRNQSSLADKSFSSVGLKPNDPMWNTSSASTTPEPGIQSPANQSHLDREFINDLLTMTEEVPINPLPVDSTSLPFLPEHSTSASTFTTTTTTTHHAPPSRAKSSSRISTEPFHIFSWGRSHSPPDNGSNKMDCSVDGQKISSSGSSGDKGHFHLKWPHRHKHHSVEEKKVDQSHSSGGHSHGSSHHFQELVHYFRRFSHHGSHHGSHSSHGSHHGSHKEMGDDKETEPPRKQRVQRISSGNAGEVSTPVVFRDRSHSMGAKPKKRAENTIQAVYTIYDSIVKEGKHTSWC